MSQSTRIRSSSNDATMRWALCGCTTLSLCLRSVEHYMSRGWTFHNIGYAVSRTLTSRWSDPTVRAACQCHRHPAFAVLTSASNIRYFGLLPRSDVLCCDVNDSGSSWSGGSSRTCKTGITSRSWRRTVASRATNPWSRADECARRRPLPTCQVCSSIAHRFRCGARLSASVAARRHGVSCLFRKHSIASSTLLGTTCAALRGVVHEHVGMLQARRRASYTMVSANRRS